MKRILTWFSVACLLTTFAGAEGDAPANPPLMPQRIVFNWHNFLSGCSTWNLEDWTQWTAQSQKMGYNAIMVHAYGNNPMAGFTFKDQSKPVGYLSTTVKGRDWSTMHVNDVRRLAGGEVFDGAVFGSEAAMVPDDQRVAAAQALMSKVFADAATRGMGVYFAVDVDTPTANPQDLITLLPESARFKAQGLWLPNPDTPEGYAYYNAQVSGLLKVYPQITQLVVWFRTGGTPWMNLKVADMPDTWQKEYAAEIARTPEAEKYWCSPCLFAIGKIVRAFERARRECDAKNTKIAAGTWSFEFLPAANRFFPEGVPLIGLDYEVLHERSQLATAERRAALRKVGEQRPVIPVIWAHHDDGHYMGRPYTPFEDFYSKLVDSHAAGFGVIHWTTRPLDLFFFSHARQVFANTKDEPLPLSCDTFAKQVLETPAMGDYLYKWVTEAPRFGRDTGSYLIDRQLTNCVAVIVGCRERLKLLEGVKGASADYYRSWENFVVAFFETHDLFQQAQAALDKKDVALARSLALRCKPEAVIRQYAALSSANNDITRGEQGLVVSMNTRWLVYYVRLRQMLGLEAVRYNFAPTSHDPLAQAPGRYTYFFDADHHVWQTLGSKETGAETFDAPSVKDELGQHGLQSNKPIVLAAQPIVNSAALLPGDYRLRLLLLDPDSTAAGQRVFTVAVNAAGKDEGWTFDPVKAAYLRLRCHGTSESKWSSLCEATLSTLAKDSGARVTASAAVEGYPAEHVLDGDPETRWAADGPDHWLQFHLNPQLATEKIGLLWYRADQRQAKFEIETSSDGQQWLPVHKLRQVIDEANPATTVDIFKEAGGANKLLERVFPVTLKESGMVTLTLTPIKGKALISGLALEPLEKE